MPDDQRLRKSEVTRDSRANENEGDPAPVLAIKNMSRDSGGMASALRRKEL